MLKLSERAHARTNVLGKSRLARLILTGFMGAGKSTVGPLLARRLGWRFLDLDSVIEAACAQSIAEIFRDHGEAYFRSQERQALQQLRDEREIVLALGGGTVEDPATLPALINARDTCVVFLDAPLPELLARARGGAEVRPLLSREEELETRHQRRLPQYRAAHLTVVTTGLRPEEVAGRVLARVSQEWLV